MKAAFLGCNLFKPVSVSVRPVTLSAVILFGIITFQLCGFKVIRTSSNQLLGRRLITMPKCLRRPDRVLFHCTQGAARAQETLHEPTPSNLSHILVDDQHKLMLCVIPKVGSTSLKTLLADANGRKPEDGTDRVHTFAYLRSLNLHYINHYLKMPIIKQRLRNYRKYIVVRHPWDRLYSAYKDKFESGDTFPFANLALINDTFGRDIVYENNVPRLTLDQFLKLVVLEYDHRFKNFHWMSYYDMCYPCYVRYDEIIKLEHLDSEIGQLLERLKDKKYNVSLSRRNTVRNSSAIQKLRTATEAITNTRPDVLAKLKHIYKRDFTLFGYSWNKMNTPSCTKNKLDQECCH